MRQRLLATLILFVITFAVVHTRLEASLLAQQEEDPGEGKSYSDVITSEAITSTGLFTTHMIGDELYYEIPLDELDREMLLLTRIAKSADGSGYGGSKVNTSVVRWERRYKRILLRLVNYENYADNAEPIARAVASSNFEPLIQSFDIETFSNDSSG